MSFSLIFLSAVLLVVNGRSSGPPFKTIFEARTNTAKHLPFKRSTEDTTQLFGLSADCLAHLFCQIGAGSVPFEGLTNEIFHYYGSGDTSIPILNQLRSYFMQGYYLGQENFNEAYDKCRTKVQTSCELTSDQLFLQAMFYHNQAEPEDTDTLYG